jgi:hypothetical protein
MIFSLICSTTALADSYLLTMSKDDQVCQHMFKLLFFENMAQTGKLELEKHEEFNIIKWVKQKYNIEQFGDWHYGAEFDINNDGKDEVVIFENKRTDPNVDDNLVYFPLSMKEKMTGSNTFAWSPEVYNKHIFLGKSHYLYSLKEYPPYSQELRHGKILTKNYPVLGAPYIRPFVLNSKYYIALIGSIHNETRHSDTINDKDSVVIQQFTQENETEDICYYIKIIDKQSK